MDKNRIPQDQARSLRLQSFEKTSLGLKSVNRARKIAVTSGKGGVGKSNVSLNLAIAYGKLQKKVLLIDADTNLANIDILLGLHARKTLGDVVLGSAFFSEVLMHGPAGVQILPGSSGMVEMMEHDSAAHDKLIAAFEEFERIYDIIIIDTGAGISENVIRFIISVDDAILVTNSEPTSIADAYAMIKIITHRDASIPIHLVVNLAVGRNNAEETFEKLQLAVRNFLDNDIDFLGFIPLDPNVPLAVAKQVPFITLFPRCTASNMLMMMARKLLKISSKDQEDKGFLQKLFTVKGG